MCETASVTVIISNKLGLHARPAMLFVEAANGFACDIGVRRTDQSETVDGKSIMQMMMLAATQGTKLVLKAKGSDATEAINALKQLVERKFDEE